MSVETIAGMTQSEFKEMLETVVEATVERTLLEMLGDPDEGLAIRSDVRRRLMRPRREAAAGQRGQPFAASLIGACSSPPDQALHRNF